MAQGLSPKENRDVPPLEYHRVYALKTMFPDLTISINGGIETLDAAEAHLAHVDGVMLGRAAYQNPYLLAEVDRRFFGDKNPPRSRAEIIEQLLPYAERQVAQGVPIHAIARHVLGLFQGQPAARSWRRYISENAPRAGASAWVLTEALREVLSRQQALQAAEVE